jgi:hypothetical protein
MIRRIKAMALALTAVLALSAMTAAGAQAAKLISSSEHTILHGEQVGSAVFTAGEGFGGVSCTTVTGSGTASGFEIESLPGFGTVSGCKDSFGRTVHVHQNEAFYTLTGAGEGHGSGSIVMTITSSEGSSVVCTTTLEAQSDTEGGTYKNLGGTSGIEAQVKNSTIISTTSGGFLNCGIANGKHETGVVEGTSVVTGKDTAGIPVEIKIE